jgi:hypothetical protein
VTRRPVGSDFGAVTAPEATRGRRRATPRYGSPVQKRPPTWLAPVRGSVLAALVTLLTAIGHVAGGGTLAALSPLAVLVPLLATALVALAERCRGLVATVVALGAGQAALHLLLLVMADHGHAPGTAFSGAAMVAAHGVATLATAAVLTTADATVTALFRAVRRAVPRRARTAPVDVAPPNRPVPDTAVPLVASLVRLTAHVRRGPPPLPC